MFASIETSSIKTNHVACYFHESYKTRETVLTSCNYCGLIYALKSFAKKMFHSRGDTYTLGATLERSANRVVDFTAVNVVSFVLRRILRYSEISGETRREKHDLPEHACWNNGNDRRRFITRAAANRLFRATCRGVKGYNRVAHCHKVSIEREKVGLVPENERGNRPPLLHRMHMHAYPRCIFQRTKARFIGP